MIVDVEGFEPEVFQGATKTLAAGAAPVILFEFGEMWGAAKRGNLGEVSLVKVVEQLDSAGYNVYLMGLDRWVLATGSSWVQWADAHKTDKFISVEMVAVARAWPYFDRLERLFRLRKSDTRA